VHHSISGRFAIRQGNWKLALCPGSGGWGKPGDAEATKQGLPAVQLYDLSTDPAETTNLHDQHPEVVQHLTQLLNDIITNGRSTPGAAQKNDVPVIVNKPNRKAAKE
jgi:arylsulfatase A-like enzyme